MNTFYKIFLTFTTVAVVLLSVAAIYQFLVVSESVPAKPVVPVVNVDQVQQEITMLPDGAFVSGTVSIQVDNFMNSGQTFEDPMNPGDYILAGDLGYCTDNGLCLDNATSESFMVTFHSADGYFNITLFSNPVSYARRDAERFLQDKLSISRSEMCNLSYNIMVPYWINEQFAGQDLRFSFCSDAVSL